MTVALAVGAVMRLREYRCYCGWLLFKGRLAAGSTVQLKCRGCREIVTILAEDH